MAIPKTTRRNLWTAIAIGAVLVAGAAVWRTSSGVDDPPAAHASGAAAPVSSGASAVQARPALTVTVTKPQSQRWPVTLTANGSIAPWQEIVVGSEISGLRLTDVLVNVGDRVERGQLLARLSAETVQADLAQIRASLVELQALSAEASANAERARKLDAGGAISAQQIAQYLTAEQTAQARVAAQRARLKAEEVRLGNTRVVAPDDGIISARVATMGAVVQPGSELFRLIRDGRLEWRAEVNGADLPRVRPGQPVRLDGPDGTPIDGKVRIVAPTIDPQSRLGIVYVDLPSPAGARAGMFARGEIEFGTSTAWTVPQSALVVRDGFSYVFRVGDDSRVAQTKVEAGRRRGSQVEVLSGLDGETTLVASGVGFLVDGDLVRIVEAPAR